ncbi:hypothetical protein [Hymenobacter canadensis]|uniref:Uncharacterized protein n=1 Tax=Hymenobacter canadensis TaxID=2999067 RepID=A0ABY7LRB0_9BACT|nr:hypothetical protein [Hymenobacter canadensis]WBA42958.1 hypothetical protein O3303_05190 [Hymenobacter canadensis]
MSKSLLPVAALPGPRDLGPSVARLLRQLGFLVWEQPTPTPSLSLVSGTWTGPPAAGCRPRRRPAGRGFF